MTRATSLLVWQCDGKKAGEGRFCLWANFIFGTMILLYPIMSTQILETATDKTNSKTLKANIFRIA